MIIIFDYNFVIRGYFLYLFVGFCEFLYEIIKLRDRFDDFNIFGIFRKRWKKMEI